jgi:DNA-binding transcriptional ArsR family regulator
MPIDYEEPSGEASPEVRIGGSIAVELDYAMLAATNPQIRSDHAELMRLYGDSSEMERRVCALWPPRETPPMGALELSILAHQGGLLLSVDADELLDRLDALAAAAPADLILGSETEEGRWAIRRRLDRLRSSPDFRARYTAVVRDLWAAIGPEWRRHGWPAVDAMVRARRELARRSAPWQEVARPPAKPLKGKTLDLVAGLPPSGYIAVIPAYFGHLTGYGYMDLPGMVLISIPALSGGVEARVRNELLARRLRGLADPTRLAMLELLSREPSTVTELAETFSLAQPTVSNHVKLLRDAGLLEAAPREGRRTLTARAETLREVATHLLGMVGEGESGDQAAGGTSSSGDGGGSSGGRDRGGGGEGRSS